MTLDEAIGHCASKSLNFAQVQSLCSGVSDDVRAALDFVALEIARRYESGAVSYAVADSILNSLFAYATRNGCLPDLMHSIFLAFDAGEYYHQGDDRSVDPESKYTRSLIRNILSEVGAA